MEKREEDDIMDSDKKIDDMSIQELLNLIKKDRILAIKLEEQINKLKNIVKEETVPTKSRKPIQLNSSEIIKEGNEDDDDIEFKNEVDYYYSLIDLVEDTSINIDSIMTNLPSKSKVNYSSIVLGIKLRLLKTIKEYKDMIQEEREEISNDFLRDIKKEIVAIQTKIDMIGQVENGKTVNNVIEPERNNLFFSLTSNGNITAIDDIVKDVPKEAYGDFKLLFNSIIDGTFKGVKRFSGNYYYSFMAEVIYHEARVIFDRVGKNDYVILGAFLKKTTTGKSYKANLLSDVNTYLLYKENIVNNLDNEDFRNQNHKYEETLFSILDGNKEKSKQYRKGEE